MECRDAAHHLEVVAAKLNRRHGECAADGNGQRFHPSLSPDNGDADRSCKIWILKLSFDTESNDAAPVLWEDADGVRTITLNRPDRLNAIDMPMILQLEDAVQSAQDAPDVAVLLLRGAGRAFCAGDDVEAQSEICRAGEASLRDQLHHLQNISEILTLGDKISVAEVGGWAIGAAFSWVLNCDFRIWGSSAQAFFPEVRLGTFVTGGATFLLPRLLGDRNAADVLFLGTRLRPGDPNAAGVVHATHPDQDLTDAARGFAVELAALPRPAASLMKHALAAAWHEEFRSALKRETEACVATTLDPGTLERMRATIARD